MYLSREKRESNRASTLQVRHLEGRGAFSTPDSTPDLPQIYPRSTPDPTPDLPQILPQTPGLPQILPQILPQTLQGAVHQGTAKRAEDSASRARNGKVIGRRHPRCDTWKHLGRFHPRFYPRPTPDLPQTLPQTLPQIYPRFYPRPWGRSGVGSGVDLE